MHRMFKDTPWEEDGLTGFYGDVGWVRRWEGHVGHPYWPGGASGLTLDPGVDLGYVDLEFFQELYIDTLSLKEVEQLSKYHKVRGADAEEVARRADVQSIRIQRSQADAVFPYVAAPYWDKITGRFPALRRAPGPVHTAFLSLAINRGPHNSDLDQLRKPLIRKDWDALAERIKKMQDNHPLRGVRRRRDEEAELVEKTTRLRNAKLKALADAFDGAPSAPVKDLPVSDSVSDHADVFVPSS